MTDHITSADIRAEHDTPIGRAEYAVAQARRALIAAEAELDATLDANPLPNDWDIGYTHANGWLVTRDYGSLVVGTGYTTRAQAHRAARRVLRGER